VPVLTQTAQSVENPNAPIVNQIEYRDTGVLLRVKPRVNGNGQVVLEVAQEFSEVARTIESGIDSPTIQQRRLESTLTVQDGGTVALGGLIRGSRARGRTGVPWLSSIPVLGAAFRTEEREQDRTELVVFLTPRVLRTAGDIADAGARAVEDAQALRERKLVPAGAVAPPPKAKDAP
jgi:general secretion pathway protein D